jgi:hypothetical protein
MILDTYILAVRVVSLMTKEQGIYSGFGSSLGENTMELTLSQSDVTVTVSQCYSQVITYKV